MQQLYKNAVKRIWRQLRGPPLTNSKLWGAYYIILEPNKSKILKIFKMFNKRSLEKK